MKYILYYFILFTTIYASDIVEKKIELKRASQPIIIDGYIDTAWLQADSVNDFTQYNPFYGGKPTQSTVAKVLSTEDAFYCLFISYDNTGKIETLKGTLDDWSGDGVTLTIDTYNDKRTAYEFAVSASGARADCRVLDDGRNKDYNWDGVWFATSQLYNWGYVTELMIPYKSISYNKVTEEWGIDFERWIPNNTEDLAWSKYEENEGVRISKFGRLKFNGLRPSAEGMNLEIYPVGITNVSRTDNNKYKVSPDAGLDVFYNPSPTLTYQLTVNPDFAQIEADPYSFNISRYETYFSERRPFFTQGNEVFSPSGRDRNTGFYSPMELFYSRRIGKRLPGGEEVPLFAGTKATGRINDWEYGGFMAMTGDQNYFDDDDDMNKTEDGAVFGVARIKKQIYDNSTMGLLFVGKKTKNAFDGVIDIDGAFRQTNWQLSYQIARSFKENSGDYALSTGFTMFDDNKMILSKIRSVGEKFDIDQVGYVPWRGTTEWTSIGGPRWYLDKGYIRQILIYFGPSLYYEKEDAFMDYSGIFGFNMQLRDNWGYELNYQTGRAKDEGQEFNYWSINLSTWINISPKWSANVWGGMNRSYNFDRDYLATFIWTGHYINWYATKTLSIGTSNNAWIERKPSGEIEDITFNARPYISFVPINHMTTRIYVDNVYKRSSQHLENLIVGFLFSYNFLPKSWIYLAYNEVQERKGLLNEFGDEYAKRLQVTDRASVVKIKYLYYF